MKIVRNIGRASLKSLWLLVPVGFILPSVHAQEAHQPPTSQPTTRVSLEREMSAMDHSFNIIRKQVRDPSQNASTLTAVMEMEQHTLAAKSVIPRSATTLPTTQANSEKLMDYQATMLNTLRQELDLEEQLRENHNDKAAAIVDSLHELESEGHAEFRPRRNRR